MGLFSGRNKIGLALGSGGARGLAHIGVIKVLVKHKIPIDFIAGSSAGALIGGMYASIQDIEKVEEIASKVTYLDFLKAFSDPSLFQGLFRGDHAVKFIENYIGKVNIEDLKIPFKAVATDIITGKTVAIAFGNLAKAIRASSSLPILFQPIKLGKHYLVDGGTSLPVPAKIVKDMGADKVIAVNLDEIFFPQDRKAKLYKKLSTLAILRSSLDLLRYHLARENVKEADIVINPNVPDVPLTKLVHGEELIKKGEDATKKILPEIKKLIEKKFLFFSS